MCGIFGVVHLDGSSAKEEEPLVERGIYLLRHRGPDSQGVMSHGPVAFGHSRLAIIDLEGGAQPMLSSDGRGLITYNGEVYNFQPLRQQLASLGYAGKTRSDTEVVLDALLAWGNKGIQRLRGIFAFALADFSRQRLWLVRDPLGVKPLFYTMRGNRLFFSSELEPLYNTLPGLRIHLKALDQALAWQYIPAPFTIYEEVYQLPPGHFLEIDLVTGIRKEQRYWKIDFSEDRSLSPEDWGNRLDAILRETVHMQLVSDVPFGAFLSGGVDSSLVMAYMSEFLDQPVHAFTVGFQELDFNEAEYARQVAIHLGAHHEVEIMAMDALGLLPTLVRHYGQPFGDVSAVPTYLLAQMARRRVKMVLSGDGGDEAFAGYRSYDLVMRAVFPDWRIPPTNNLRARFRALARYFYYRWRLLWQDRERLACELHTLISNNATPPERRQLWQKKYRDLVDKDSTLRWQMMKDYPGSLLSRLQALDFATYLPYDILTKVDIASMAHGLEVRVPLLDPIVIETAATLPAEMKLREERVEGILHREKKWILRQIAKRYFPAPWIDRAKQGFRPPLKRWFAGKWKEEIRRRLLTSSYLPAYFSIREIERLLVHHSENHDLSPRLWNLLFIEEWMRQHPDALR